MMSHTAKERARHLDVSLIKANLALSAVERLRRQEGLAEDISTLRAAVRTRAKKVVPSENAEEHSPGEPGT